MTLRRSKSRGFTLVELLVVIAIIALLISILLPSLSRAREQAKKIRCLGNLKDLSAASTAYSIEDADEEIVPRGNLFTRIGGVTWAGGVIGEREWGGKGGRVDDWVPGSVNSGEKYYTQGKDDDPEQKLGPGNRVLNRIIYPAIGNAMDEDQAAAIEADNGTDMPAYQCPSDVGISSSRDSQDLIGIFGGDYMFADLSEEAPFYRAFGNSYKAYFLATVFQNNPPGLPPNANAFSYGAALRPVSQVPTPSRTVLYGEGNSEFTYIWNRANWGNPDHWGFGWHGEKQVYTVAFVDGHAGIMDQNVRMQDAIGDLGSGFLYSPEFKVAGSRPEYVYMAASNPLALRGLLFRGQGWQLDVFPAPVIPIFSFQM